MTTTALHNDFLLRAGLLSVLLSTTVLQRFGLNLGEFSLGAGLAAMYGLLGIATFCGALRLSIRRLTLYGVCGLVVLASTLANYARASVSSAALLMTMFLPFVFVLSADTRRAANPGWAARAFLDVALFAAIAGIVQFYVQFVYRPAWLFDFTPYLPNVLRGPAGFNTAYAVGSWYKSNGFFFREPSDFSLILALAILIEYWSQRRYPRLACYGFALLLTYSGTGFVMLLAGFLFPLTRWTFVRIFGLAAVGALAVWLAGDFLNLEVTLRRVGEFGSQQSSAYSRYIAPARLLIDTYDTNFWTPLLGHGPGMISRIDREYVFHDPTWAKLGFEYGFAGFVSFTALYVVALFRSAAPVQVRAALLCSWLVTGNHLLSPILNCLTLFLLGLFAEPRDERDAEAALAASNTWRLPGVLSLNSDDK